MTARKQLKRLAAPRQVKLLRKERKWTVKAKPGPHGAEQSLPILLVIRDYLKLVETSTEAKKVLKAGEVLVDGRKVTSTQFPVGFMDIVSIPAAKKACMLVLDSKGRLELLDLKEEAKFKLVKVKKVMQTKKGIQVTLHDGRNILTKEKIKNGDVLKIEVPSQKIIEHFPLAVGYLVYITGGTHAGETGKIEQVIEGTMTRAKQVQLKVGETSFITPVDYIFVVGKDKPAVSLR